MTVMQEVLKRLAVVNINQDVQLLELTLIPDCGWRVMYNTGTSYMTTRMAFFSIQERNGKLALAWDSPMIPNLPE